MDWRHLFLSLEGRISRLSFWIGVLVVMMVNAAARIVDGVLGLQLTEAAGPVATLASLVMLWPSILLYAKRWHDRDKSGWWTLLFAVPVIGWIWALVECGFLAGTRGANRFGPDPRDPSAPEARPVAGRSERPFGRQG